MTEIAAPIPDEAIHRTNARPPNEPARRSAAAALAGQALILGALGCLLAGCSPQPSYPPLSPETQANEACTYLGQGPGTPVYRTCYSRTLSRLQSAAGG